jgi:outer membrane protein TolC
VYFSYPLLLRKERGKIQQVEIKQSQLEFERQQKEREIVNSINIQHNNSVMLNQQIAAQQQQVSYSRVLRDAEQTRFFAGESSFFLVNTREMALINSEIRLYELKVRYAKATAQLFWASGTLLAQ